jgi:hypothetical protein
MEIEAATHRCLKPFRWEFLRGWDFRPQLIVVSGLFGGNPFVDGILGHNLLLSRAFLVGIPSWMGFWATTYCCLGPFRWESLRGWDFRPQLIVVSGLSSQPLLFFHGGILAIRKPFSRTFLFHDGILAIGKPFSRTFSFSRWNSGYQEAFLTNFFFFHYGILAIRKPFSRTFSFSRWNSGY